MPILSALSNLKRKPKVLILGSGGLSIGQAGEFDYSGNQAIKALQEEGIEVVVVNPNIATVQTNPEPGKKVYLYPVEADWVEKIIETERPDGIIAGFGGQTALNCLLKLEEAGVLEKYKVTNLGTSAKTLRLTEDRDLFARQMEKISMPVPPSQAATTLEEAMKAAEKIGYPVILRAAYALGGLGSGFAANADELQTLARAALGVSPQVLIEKSLKGWKELEYEVMRDAQGNTITICNMENMDPLGIHTGDSIVVAPSQTLSDEEFQTLRDAAIKIINSLEVIGECNVQFALNPKNCEFFVIEVNARLSRSSALASKATGYPIAYIAAKVVLGYDLLELKNPVTGITFAFFEPALDYVAVKIPRWDLTKFRGVSRNLGSAMKSVGEVMALGRSFPEALQKAVRMVTETSEGLTKSTDSIPDLTLDEDLRTPTDLRLYSLVKALRQKQGIDRIYGLSCIDPWFLSQIQRTLLVEDEIASLAKKTSAKQSFINYIEAAFAAVTPEIWRRWKRYGYGDEQIIRIAMRHGFPNSTLVTGPEIQEAALWIRKKRIEAGVKPVVKKIDTTAGEYPSPSNYLYVTYEGQFDDPLPKDPKAPTAIVLGGGAYRIGTSVEFDWCAVSCSAQLQKAGWRSIMINCNPETVSTDFNSSDRLYFEEMTLERILDISEFENSRGVIACMGGQLPNRLALPLARAGVVLIGHSPDTIDQAEDRSRFSAILDQLGVDQPYWTAASSRAEIDRFTANVGFPVLVRPSYVLSGAAMNVAYDQESLDHYLSLAADVSSEHPVVISKFLEEATEFELDGVARDGQIVVTIVSEHVENAGVHSGDSTAVVPPQSLDAKTIAAAQGIAGKIAEGLRLNGPFNIQFLGGENSLKVIECNARAARSFPFVSKVYGINLAEIATQVIIAGKDAKTPKIELKAVKRVGVKAPMFSFARLEGADPVLGVEMASTGEVGCVAPTFDEAILLAFEATAVRTPKKGVLVSSGREHEKEVFLDVAPVLEKQGIQIYATTGTARSLSAHGHFVKTLAWPGEALPADAPNPAGADVIEAIQKGWVDLVINIPKNFQKRELEYGAQIRKAAIKYGCSLITDIEKARAFIEAFGRHPKPHQSHRVAPL